MAYLLSKGRYGPLNFPARRKRSGPLRWRLAGLGLAGLISAWGLVLWADAEAPMPPQHVQPAIAPAPAPAAWIPINRPLQLYGLEAPDLAKLPKSYEASRHQAGGGRQDVLNFGSSKLDGAYFQLVLYRTGTEDMAEAPFFVELARRASANGLAITHSPTPGLLPTRFGDSEVADVTLASAEGAMQPCLGFRLKAKPLAWRMAGFACGGAKPLARPALQCLFDRLSLNAAGEDVALAKFFADTELRRNPACAGTHLTPSNPRLTALEEPEVSPAPAPPPGSKRTRHQ